MNVVNFGSLNIDHVYAVDHFCRAGETIHTKSYTQNAGGKGLNQSIAVSRSGQKVHHAGLLGPEGTRLAELLSGSGVDLRYLKHTDVPQGHAVIQVQPDGQNCIFLYGGSNQAVTPQEIDEINILNASFLAMHRALDQLAVRPEALLVDGNRFKPYRDLPHTTVVKGDGKYMSIAAASILAKTYRDDYMLRLHEEYPVYRWDSNKGYPAKAHREAIRRHGVTPYHRMSYNLLGDGQMELFAPAETKGR